MKRIAESCDRLTRLHVLYGHKEFAPDDIEKELWQVCYNVWGYTPDDVDDEALPADVQAWLDKLHDDNDSAAAQVFAVENDYDLTDQGKPLFNWWFFVLMILAEKHNLFTPEHVASARLKAEAAKFQEDKEAGG